MSRLIKRLEQGKIAALGDGRFCDGAGLYLCCDGPRRRWIWKYRFGGRNRELGLGPVATVSLAQARKAADKAREKVRNGVDPIAVKAAERIAEAPKPEIKTFGKCAEEFIKSQKGSWKNAKHRSQWPTTLNTFCAPLMQMPVAEITTDHIEAVIKPIWSRIPETASRVLGRIKIVLDWATAKKYRHGDNPARWSGMFEHLLAPRQTTKPHHPALPFRDMPKFVARLRATDDDLSRALDFVILTACRVGEVLEARWQEIDIEKRLWTVPARRMKTGQEHVVPLSDAAMRIIDKQAKSIHEPKDFVFPGKNPRKPLSQTGLRRACHRINPAVTVHGFRSSFRDWCGDEMDVEESVAEAALAHTIGSKTKKAYRHGTALEKRRVLMQDWADYVGGTGKIECRSELSHGAAEQEIAIA